MSNAEGVAGTAQRGKWQVLVFTLVSVFMVNGFIFTSFNLLLQTVTTNLGWTGEERALVASALPTGMIWTVFIAGIMLDKFSVKKLMGSFQLIGAVLVVLRGVLTGATVFYVVMFLFGVCSAILAPASTKLIGLWFGQKDLALVNGALTSASPLGQLTGNLAAVPIMTALGGWQRIFWLQGILLAVVGICVLLFCKERRNIDAELSSEKITSEEDLGVWKNIKGVAKVPQFWLYVIGHACMLGMIYGGNAVGYTVYQVDPRWSLTVSQAGVITACNNIASMCMYVLAPFLIGKFLAKNYETNYRKLAIFCGFFSAAGFVIGWRTYSFIAMCVIYFLTGITFGQIVPVCKVLMMKLPEVSGPRAGTGLGILMTVERIAQTAITAVVGVVIAANPENGGVAMSFMCLCYAVPSVMIILAMIVDKNKAKKEPTASVV